MTQTLFFGGATFCWLFPPFQRFKLLFPLKSLNRARLYSNDDLVQVSCSFGYCYQQKRFVNT